MNDIEPVEGLCDEVVVEANGHGQNHERDVHGSNEQVDEEEPAKKGEERAKARAKGAFDSLDGPAPHGDGICTSLPLHLPPASQVVPEELPSAKRTALVFSAG